MLRHVMDYLEGIAEHHPERPAAVFRAQSGFELRLSYGELDARARRAARVLAALGLERGDHVGCHLYDTPAHLDLMLGAWKVGIVPINVNVRYRQDELGYLFRDADLRLVLTEPELADDARRAAEGCELLGHVLEAGNDWEQRLAEVSGDPPNGQERAGFFAPRTGDEHYVLYTGGTTGMPKGTVWRHEDILHAAFGVDGNATNTPPPVHELGAVLAQIEQRMASATLRVLPLFPLMHGGGQWGLARTYTRGGCMVKICDPHCDVAFAMRVAQEERVERVSGAGDAHARPVVEFLQSEAAGSLDLRALSSWATGAVMMSHGTKEALAAALPGLVIHDLLGASETGSQGLAAGYSDEGSPRIQLAEGHLIVDEELRPIPKTDSRVGRLAKSGRIPLGYYEDPQKTAETFPTIDGIRYAIVGDMARWEQDGTVTLFGRGSVSINTGGEKVFPEEVEKALKTHPAIDDALVVGTPDERFGSRVTAVVSLRPGHESPGLVALAAHCKTLLSGYKAPRALVIEERVMRSPSGKPDYRWAAEAARRAR